MEALVPSPPIPQAMAADEFFARTRARLTLDVPAGLTDQNYVPGHGDHELDPVMAALAAVRPIRPAAVLVPIVMRDEPMVLLTQRTAHLKNHAGQISFPGGKIEASDQSPLAAALREAEEEIALPSAFVRPIGYLDLYLSAFGFRIVPVVARIEPGFELTLNPGEVDDAFEVPLAFLMAPENHQQHTRPWNGMTRTYYAMPFGERYIWGATAGILRNLWERVYQT
jgi:8-oxo-dGTP pyrophosphatase MutT (NUDIX family)